MENDNAGFYEHVLNNDNIKNYLNEHPNHRLYGEWLVPHTLKTYRDDAWREFYVFDVTIDKSDGGVEYIPYDIYKPLLDKHGLNYIPPIAKVRNPSYESLIKSLEKADFLIEDGKGVGEGIIIKNYNFYNKFGRQVWAKIVSNEFKEKHNKTMGYNEFKEKRMVEDKIVDDFCTESFIEKEYAKIVNEKGGWKSQYIPMLLGKIYHELIVEESWNIVKKYKNPTIDFKTLQHLIVEKIKLVKKDLFV